MGHVIARYESFLEALFQRVTRPETVRGKRARRASMPPLRRWKVRAMIYCGGCCK